MNFGYGLLRQHHWRVRLPKNMRLYKMESGVGAMFYERFRPIAYRLRLGVGQKQASSKPRHSKTSYIQARTCFLLRCDHDGLSLPLDRRKMATVWPVRPSEEMTPHEHRSMPRRSKRLSGVREIQATPISLCFSGVYIYP